MAVIINDFEVVTEPPASQEQSGDTQEGQQSEAKGPTPHEIEHIIEREMERSARVWAH